MESREESAGYRKFVEAYHLTRHRSVGLGFADWKLRMGVHMAFHRNRWNVALHAAFSLVNAWGVMMILYPLGVSGIDGAMVALLVSFLIYARIDRLAAAVTAALFASTWPLCGWVYGLVGPLGAVAIGLAANAVALAVQVGIGHRWAEGGIDDAVDNFRELFVTRNPLYLVLLPLYTYLDLLFRLGYRPELAEEVSAITEELRSHLELERQTVRPAP